MSTTRSKWTMFGAYLMFVGLLAWSCARLADAVAPHVVGIAVAALPKPKVRSPSRVEQQLIQTAEAQESKPEVPRPVIVLNGPNIKLGALAAQLDKSERADLLPVETRTRTTSGRRVRHVRMAGGSAGEIFGRQLGVMLVASR